MLGMMRWRFQLWWSGLRDSAGDVGHGKRVV